MKKLLMGLVIFGMMNYSAAGQTKKEGKTGKSQFDVNYPVCTYKNGYNVCSKNEKNAQVKALKASENATKKEPPLESKNQVVFVRCQSAVEETPGYSSVPRRHNIVVSYDNMDNPYKGLPSKQYDGPVKNETRNLNVNQTSIALPPIDGKIASK